MNKSRWFLVALLGGMGIAHVVVPKPFESMIPTWLPGSRSAWNLAAAGAELTSAALLANKRTVRAGGAIAFATFAVVYVANVQAALDGGYRGAPGFLGSATLAWLRLPLQLPLLWWSWRLANGQRSRVA